MKLLNILSGGGSYVVYGMIAVSLAGGVVWKANHDKNRGIAQCEEKWRLLNEAAEKAAKEIEDRAEEITDEIIDDSREDATDIEKDLARQVGELQASLEYTQSLIRRQANDAAQAARSTDSCASAPVNPEQRLRYERTYRDAADGNR